MEIKALLRNAKLQLAESSISEVDAEHLLAHLLGLSRMDLHNPVLVETTLAAVSDTDVIEEQFFALLDRRINHEPLQYLTGLAPFRYLEIQVGPGVLVPRPESELLVDAVLAHIKNLPAPVSVIDLGAGSGALALAIATEAPDTRVIAVEKSPAAIFWLKKNTSVIAENVRVVEGDVADVLGKRIFHVPAGNYICRNPVTHPGPRSHKVSLCKCGNMYNLISFPVFNKDIPCP